MTRARSSNTKWFCLALLWVSVWLVWPARRALATPPAHHERCACPATADSAPQAVAHADAVFVGEVRDIADPSQSALLLLAARFNTRLYQPIFEARQVILAVSQSWKGVETAQIKLWTKPVGGECGYPFMPGEHYLVYAQRVDERWVTSVCSRTRAVIQATTDLAYLRSLPDLPLRSNLTWGQACWLVIAMLALSTAGAYFRLRRSQKPLRFQSPPM